LLVRERERAPLLHVFNYTPPGGGECRLSVGRCDESGRITSAKRLDYFPYLAPANRDSLKVHRPLATMIDSRSAHARHSLAAEISAAGGMRADHPRLLSFAPRRKFRGWRMGLLKSAPLLLYTLTATSTVTSLVRRHWRCINSQE